MTNQKLSSIATSVFAFSVLLSSLVGASCYYLTKHAFIEGFCRGYRKGVISTYPESAGPSEEYIDD